MIVKWARTSGGYARMIEVWSGGWGRWYVEGHTEFVEDHNDFSSMPPEEFAQAHALIERAVQTFAIKCKHS